MAVLGTVRVAAVQAMPVVLDVEATIDKAVGLLADAAGEGASLVVFPECFVSLYPSGAWAAAAAAWTDGCDELWERLWASSVDVGGEHVARLGWLASVRHIAIEAGAFVVSAPQYIPASGFPADFPLALLTGVDVFGRGGACVVSPTGDVIAGPLYDSDGIVTADCDLRAALHAKRYFDVAGHDGRTDVLSP